MDDLPAPFLVGKLANRLRRKITEMTSDFPYTGAQGKVLHYLLAQEEDVYQKDVEQEFSLRPSSATELLKKMEASGLIFRVQEEKDARLKKIVLTEKALSFKSEVQKRLEEMNCDVLKGIKEKDLDTFRKVCLKMLDNILP